MEIQQFRYFLAAARYENLTKAAEDLHIAQPALSQSIKRLETELGVSLFDRKNHRIELNEQGKLLKKRLVPLRGKPPEIPPLSQCHREKGHSGGNHF